MPHIGWEPVRLGGRLGADRGDRRPDTVLLRPQLHPAPGPGDRPARHGGPRRALRLRDRPAAGLRRPVSPGEVERRRPAAAGELRRHLRPGPGLICYPAIDIRDGHAVRLVQGDYERETSFDADPLDAARRWVEQGARALHVVDLDGARAGAPVNLEHVARICDAVEVPVQVGGGLRQAGDVSAVLSAGAARAILGTAAISDPALVESLVAEHGERIVVSADARGGAVAVQGWERETGASVAGVIADLGAARYADVRLHSGRGRRHARGPGARCARRRGRRRGDGGRRADLLGRDRRARPPAAAGRGGPPGGHRGDRGQGPLRGQVHGRRGDHRARRRLSSATYSTISRPRSSVGAGGAGGPAATLVEAPCAAVGDRGEQPRAPVAADRHLLERRRHGAFPRSRFPSDRGPRTAARGAPGRGSRGSRARRRRAARRGDRAPG